MKTENYYPLAFTFPLVLALIFFNPQFPLAVEDHFINVTNGDFLVVMTNTTQSTDRYYIASTLYHGMNTGLTENDTVIGSPTGVAQSHAVKIFVHGADFANFYNYYATYGYKTRYSASPHISGIADQSGLNTGLYIDGWYMYYGWGPISWTQFQMMLWLLGYAMFFIPLFVIGYRKRELDLKTLMKLVACMLIGFGILAGGS